MSEISYQELSKPSLSQWLELFNDPKIKKHMPLAQFNVDENWVENWITNKEKLQIDCGFEIHSIWIESNFAGWAGIQPDNENFEIAIVLKPDFWGYGLSIYQNYINEYKSRNLSQPLMIYLPLSRNIEGLLKRFELEQLPKIEISGFEFQVLKIQN